MKEKQELSIDIEQFINELIRQRSLTMEDGRSRRAQAIMAVDQKTEEPKVGPDDGDLL